MISGDLVQAALEANRLAEFVTSLPTAEQAGVAQRLQDSAAGLAEVDPELASELIEAAEALQRGEFDRFQQALQEAVVTMEQRGAEQAVGEQALVVADELKSARGEVAAAGDPDEATAKADGDQNGQSASGQGQAGQESSAGLDAGSGVNSGAGSDAQEGQGAGGPGPGGGHADVVYVPDYVDLALEEGVGIQLPAECVTNTENCGQLINERPAGFTDEQSLVPYEQVFGDYRNAAYEALEGDYVPLGMKGLVRDYFSSLEP
jgi:hypothetical protein